MFDAYTTANQGEYLVADRLWRPDDTERYIERQCDAVYLSPGRAAASKMDLKFLHELPGLRRVAVEGPVRDLDPIFDLVDLRGLALMGASKRPVRLSALTKLDTLFLAERPGLETIGGLRALQHLTIGKFSGDDLHILGDKPELRYLRIEGRYGTISLEALQHCTRLHQFELIDANARSLQPLAGLGELEELVIAPNSKDAVNDPIDLTPIQNISSIRLLRLDVVASVAPLRHMTGLQRVVITTVVDGDLIPLRELSPEVEIHMN